MTLSGKAKLVITAVMLGAILLYLVIVDLGVSAGRIHHGVEIRGGLEVGGMTRSEASDRLKNRVKLMLNDEIVLGGEGLSVHFFPRRPPGAPEDALAAGWRPRRKETIEAAFEVGRTDGPFAALADRVDAWFGGLKISWQGAPKALRVNEILCAVERRAQKRGLALDRTALRLKIRQLLNTWPRKPFYRIPFLEDDAPDYETDICLS
ncbi:MAG: hypothetical protein M3285_05910 [Actinomycetota bacterium]|nr:hypothetical protein [Actinomycetota bacterium]